MTNYTPRHVSKGAIEAIDEKIRQMEEQKRIEEEENYNKEIREAMEELEEETKTEQREDRKTEETENGAEQDEEVRDDWSPEKAVPPLIACALGALVIIGLLGVILVRLVSSQETVPAEEPVQETEVHPMDPELRSMWLSNRAINEDYVGQIVFDSGLIDLPFVQAKGTIKEDGEPYRFFTADGQLVEDPYAYNGNDVYIWTSWKTGEYDRYGEGGSVFLDYRNYLKDQNIILYGHHFARDWDPSGSKQFTPLDVLLSEENYEENKTLKLILDNEIRSYVITNVFTVDIEDDYESQIIRTDMNEDFSGNPEPRFFRDFIDYMNRISRYETKESLDSDDRILTLITCLEHQPQYRQVIVCREVSDEIYDPS